MEEDWVRVTRVGTPQDDEVGFFGLFVGTRSAACSEHCRQTDDTWSVSGTVAGVDGIGTNSDTDELLREVVHLVGALGTTHYPESPPTVPPGNRLDTAGRSV